MGEKIGTTAKEMEKSVPKVLEEAKQSELDATKNINISIQQSNRSN